MEAKQNKQEVNEGWIRLYRKSTESRVFQNAELWKVWTWCLIKACHSDQWVPMKTGKGIEEVPISRGQFVFGRNVAAKALKMPPQSVYNRMLKLKNMRNLDIQSNTHYSIVTILNYNTYQGDGQNYPTPIMDNHRTAIGQAKDTYKNDKNEKNEREENTPTLVNPKDSIAMYKVYKDYAAIHCPEIRGCDRWQWAHKDGDCFISCKHGYNDYLTRVISRTKMQNTVGFCQGVKDNPSSMQTPDGMGDARMTVCGKCPKRDRWSPEQMRYCQSVKEFMESKHDIADDVLKETGKEDFSNFPIEGDEPKPTGGLSEGDLMEF